MNLQESIRRLKEETEGINTFLDEISNVHELSDELKNFIKEFIIESKCKQIRTQHFQNLKDWLIKYLNLDIIVQ